MVLPWFFRLWWHGLLQTPFRMFFMMSLMNHFLLNWQISEDLILLTELVESFHLIVLHSLEAIIDYISDLTELRVILVDWLIDSTINCKLFASTITIFFEVSFGRILRGRRSPFIDPERLLGVDSMILIHWWLDCWIRKNKFE